MRVVCLAVIAAVVLPCAAFSQEPVWTLDPETTGDQPVIVAGMGDDLTLAGSPVPIAINETVFARLPGEIVSVPLPAGRTETARVLSRTRTTLGGEQLVVSFLDAAGSGLILYRNDGNVLGSMWTEDGEFRIEADAEGELSLFAAPILRQADIPQRGQWHASASQTAMDDTGLADPWLDVIFAYDPDYRSATRHNVLDYFDADIGALNETFAASGVALRARILDIDGLSNDNSVSSADLLASVINRTGEFAAIDNRIQQIGADIYSVRRRQNVGRDGGVACEFPTLDDPTSTYQGRFHVGVCRFSSFVHNIGHNLGLMHGVAVDGDSHPGGLPVRWARGYRNEVSAEDGEPFNSVMTGQSPVSYRFADAGVACPERGSLCGVPVGSEGEANAALALRTYAIGPATQGQANPRLRTAVLPSSRTTSAAGSSLATAFMTVLNPSGVAGTNCRIQHHEAENDSFAFTETDPATNAVVGSPNTPFDLAPGSARTFVIEYAPAGQTHLVTPLASCSNLPINDVTVGLNTLRTTGEFGARGQLVALSATIGNTGYVSVPDGRRGVFSVATINLGNAASLTVRAASLDTGLPATGQVCQTDAMGVCMAAPADSLQVEIGPGETPTFGVFVRTEYPTPFAPRRRFEFQMLSGGLVVASTSVAVRDEGPLRAPEVLSGSVNLDGLEVFPYSVAGDTRGYADRFEIVEGPARGTIEFDPTTGAYTYTAPLEPGSDRFTWRSGNSGAWSQPAETVVNVSDLPLPTVESFSETDDAGFDFTYDFDRIAGGRISRFNLLSAPADVTYSFNPVSGRLESTWPVTPGTHVFTFEAENERGVSTEGTLTIGTETLTPCIAYSHSGTRIARRIDTFQTDGTNTASIAEAEALVRHLCYPMVNSGSSSVDGRYPNSFQADSTWIEVFVRTDAGQNPYLVGVYRRVGNRTFLNAGEYCFSNARNAIVQCTEPDAILP